MKKIFCYFLFIVLHFNLNAQIDTSYKPIEDALIWKIEGNGLVNTSYLFGTIHSIPINFLDTSLKLSTIISSCKSIYTEVSDSEVWAKNYLPANKNIKNFLPKRHYKKVQKAINEIYGITNEEDSIFRQNPYNYYNMMMGYYTKTIFTSYDEYLLIIAHKYGLNKKGLETFEDRSKEGTQKTINFDGLIYFLETRNEEIERYTKHLKNYINHYVNQTYINATNNPYKFELFDTFVYNMLDKRNLNWLPKIINAAQKESCFFAFGAAHLAGKNGVVNLLRKAGYKVVPVL